MSSDIHQDDNEFSAEQESRLDQIFLELSLREYVDKIQKPIDCDFHSVTANEVVAITMGQRDIKFASYQPDKTHLLVDYRCIKEVKANDELALLRITAIQSLSRVLPKAIQQFDIIGFGISMAQYDPTLQVGVKIDGERFFVHFIPRGISNEIQQKVVIYNDKLEKIHEIPSVYASYRGSYNVEDIENTISDQYNYFIFGLFRHPDFTGLLGTHSKMLTFIDEGNSKTNIDRLFTYANMRILKNYQEVVPKRIGVMIDLLLEVIERNTNSVSDDDLITDEVENEMYQEFIIRAKNEHGEEITEEVLWFLTELIEKNLPSYFQT